jgi:hypothetical protein
MLLPKWSSYLACHPDIPALEALRAGVISPFEVSSMPLTPDKMSSHLMSLKSPSSIILTLGPVNFSITMTHHHGSLGLSVNGSLHCIALTGMHSQAHPVILAMNHLFASTKGTHCIPLYDVMLETANKLLSILKNLQPFKGVRNYTPKAVLSRMFSIDFSYPLHYPFASYPFASYPFAQHQSCYPFTFYPLHYPFARFHFAHC